MVCYGEYYALVSLVWCSYVVYLILVYTYHLSTPNHWYHLQCWCSVWSSVWCYYYYFMLSTYYYRLYH